MEFKLRLVSDRPTAGDLVLEAETPLSGLEFIEAVGKDLRRSIDHVSRYHHTTLGALATYEVTVPQAMAVASRKFETTSVYTVILEPNLLSHFIFYKADVFYKAAGRRCYPYLDNEATLVSLIDELAFLNAWANAGYADRLAMSGDKVVAGEYVANGDTTTGIGCEGCTCPIHDFSVPPPSQFQPSPYPLPPMPKPGGPPKRGVVKIPPKPPKRGKGGYPPPPPPPNRVPPIGNPTINRKPPYMV